MMFEPLPPVPDHPALERAILELLGARGDVRAAARAEPRRPALQLHGRPDHGQQPDGRPPRLGPHAEGRLPALQGATRLRPALPERLRLPGPAGRGRGREVARAELEARDRGVRARRVRRALQGARRALRRRDHRAVEAARHVDGLGQRLLHLLATRTSSTSGASSRRCTSRGWLYKGHRSTQWCPRCGTSLSKHEQAGEENYNELEHPVALRALPAHGREGESLVVWTTTPWTLPANVAAAVKPDAEYGRRDDGDWVAVARYPDEHFAEQVRGEELVGLEYEGPFDDLPAQEGVVHRVIPWDDVSLDEGTGIVHIAPGCGAEDFELSRVHDLPVLDADRRVGPDAPRLRRVRGPDDRGGRGAGDRGRCASAGLLVERGHDRPPLSRSAGAARRRSSSASSTTGSSRREEIRQPMLDGNATVEWTPPHYKKRMDDWLRNMGDWNISRKRYFGLPLPFYPCECGHLNVIGSRAELEERATCGARPAAGAAPAVDRRGADPLRGLRRRGRAHPRGRRRLARRRHRPLLDARLAEPGVDRGRQRDRAPRRA